MILEMKVPSPGESISEVEIAQWLVADGDYVTCRFSANSNSGFYLYGGGNYNSWQVFYLPGAQANQG